MVERKLVAVYDNCVLPELGGIDGPVSPSKITMDAILKMVMAGRTVYECDPANPAAVERRVRLTLENVKSVNFGSAAAEPKKEDTAANHTEPQIPASDPAPQETSVPGEDTVEAGAIAETDTDVKVTEPKKENTAANGKSSKKKH